MVGVELALAIVATVDLALKYGDRLVYVCGDLKAVEKPISDLLLRVETAWMRTRDQLDILAKVSRLMKEDHQQNSKEILDKLVETLQIAIKQLERVLHRHQPEEFNSYEQQDDVFLRVKRFHYVFKKEKLEKTVSDLEAWQRLFDPTWFLIMTIANPIIDNRLAELDSGKETIPVVSAKGLRRALRPTEPTPGIFRSDSGIDKSSIQPIPYSIAKVARRAGSSSSSSQRFILDPSPVPRDANSEDVINQTRDLARKMMHADPDVFGLLRCKGVLKRMYPNSSAIAEFTFLFAIPVGLSEPCGLRSLLLDRNHYHSLSDRLQVAKDLAQSVYYIHTFGFVHKNIRPENILIFQNGVSDIGSAFLIGFEGIRWADADSRRISDSIPERDFYRHPDRQGLDPREYYIMQHDIYSLGVCLLEIGMWTSLVGDFARERGRADVKDELVAQAQNELPRRMGSRYARVVETCLTCLDFENEDFGDEAVLQDENGLHVSVRYIEKILDTLEEIRM